ncbi:P12 family lipoprotein [Borrelia hermsii]|uniref:BBK01-like protein n=3 Tax=Borrelia hermsii TaxID=140 RepID=Q1CNX9_BORHD|nr:P12 family lipoprotein [Borrelia hermsii]AAV88063.1 BBK01-like protein [Borrelia hermsii]ABF82182.1 BBK01-like protein [Borrelia hermsii DAH]AMR76051.1 hypothetical protein A0V01_05410 [Borrelia hermsii]ANA43953.1 putative lipoprotein [Borrelia hermsii HS1]UPA08383.1 P12 family lipoprotein [Borrelia hermsii DAH]
MKKSILTVCMFMLLCLLSCDINALNDLLGEAREKFLDGNKKNKDLHYIQGNQDIQEEQEEIVNGLEEREIIQQDIEVEPVVPVNVGISVSQQGYPYYIQEEKIEIKEEDLIPNTKEEKEAEAEIEKVKSVLEKSGFQQLIENAHELKDRYERVRADFYDIMEKIQSERTSLSKKHKENIEKIRKLTQLQNRLNEERSNLDMLMTQVDSGLNERISAKCLFEEAQKTLKEAITKRLESASRVGYSFRRVNSNLPKQLSREARRYAENSLEQLESSSMRIIETAGAMKGIENLIKEATFFLANLVR